MGSAIESSKQCYRFLLLLLYIIYIPPCAKQTFSLGNFCSTPPIVIQHIAVAVSLGMPENGCQI